MRVLHVGKYYPPFSGGIENFMADLLPAQARAGVQAAALVHAHAPAHRAWEQLEGVAVRRVPTYGRLLYAPISPGFPAALASAIRTCRPDLLHLHMPNTSAFWALLSPLARRLPWVVHWHSDVVASRIDRRLALAYRTYRPLEQRLLARSAAIIATSPPYLAASAALAPHAGRCRVIPLGLRDGPEPAPLPRDDPAWPPGRFRVLCIGRMSYYKGHEVLLRALTALPGAHLVLVGEGERRPLLEADVAERGLTDRVNLAGKVADDRLQALLNTCDCLCLPSVERTEAFGVVLLEAMRCGKPAVVSDIPGSGVPWVVQHERTGLVVPVNDPDAIRGAITRLAAESGLAARLGAAAAERFRSEFRIEAVAAQTSELYREVLGL